MPNLTEFAAHVELRRGSWLTQARNALLKLFAPRPFADFPDQKLADHRWALQSALFRAVRLRDGEDIDRLQKLRDAMEREMRHRGLL
jgi:hypothetical protein